MPASCVPERCDAEGVEGEARCGWVFLACVKAEPTGPGDRIVRGLPAFVPAGMNGVRLLGMHHDAIIFLVEQLYGAKACHKYKFRYHQHEGEEEELPLNPHGCARAEFYVRWGRALLSCRGRRFSSRPASCGAKTPSAGAGGSLAGRGPCFQATSQSG